MRVLGLGFKGSRVGGFGLKWSVQESDEYSDKLLWAQRRDNVINSPSGLC